MDVQNLNYLLEIIQCIYMKKVICLQHIIQQQSMFNIGIMVMLYGMV